tara:strand:+ start:11416 stop:12162 length:747 start_codon:yes stop_codon:yes gene_type:complete
VKFISKDQFKFYWENGYLIIENFFSHEEAEYIHQALNDIARKDFKPLLNMDRIEETLKQNPDCDPKDMKRTAKIVRETQCNPKMVSILEELYERELQSIQSLIVYKRKSSPYKDQAWNSHQDNSYIQNPNNLCFAVGYPLIDISPKNGGLYVYPGSNKEDVLPVRQAEGINQKIGKKPGNACEIPSHYKKLDIFLKKGDALIFHGNLIHGSYPNTSDASRPLFLISYLPVRETFLAGKTSNRKAIPLR